MFLAVCSLKPLVLRLSKWSSNKKRLFLSWFDFKISLVLSFEPFSTIILKLSLKKDKPIDLHFYEESYNGNVGIKPVDDDKILYNKLYEDDDHTSEIKEVYNINKYLLVVTANSIYIIFNPFNGNTNK